MSKPKDILVAVRFTPKEMPILELVTTQLGTTPSKWILELARQAIDQHTSKIGATMPRQSEEQVRIQPPTPALMVPPAGTGLSGHGGEGLLLDVSGDSGAAGNRRQVDAANPVPQLVLPKWTPQPRKPTLPAWNPTGAGPATVDVEAGSNGLATSGRQETAPLESPSGKTYECEECKDQGGGILVECLCGRYRNQQGEVLVSADFKLGPREWGTAFKLMEGMQALDRQEKFFEWSKGGKLPVGWSGFPREIKIEWLNTNWPLV